MLHAALGFGVPALIALFWLAHQLRPDQTAELVRVGVLWGVVAVVLALLVAAAGHLPTRAYAHGRVPIPVQPPAAPPSSSDGRPRLTLIRGGRDA